MLRSAPSTCHVIDSFDASVLHHLTVGPTHSWAPEYLHLACIMRPICTFHPEVAVLHQWNGT